MIRCNIKKELRGTLGPLFLDVDFSLEEKKTLALFGASGVGKTSILRMIAGLMQPDEGKIEIDEATWFDVKTGTNLPPQQRNVGYVFQDYALFPAMTVLDNIRYAAKEGGQDLVQEAISFMELDTLKDQHPELLSGGQKQRVALARAVVQRPQLLLLDEPLAALDGELRLKLQDYIIDIKEKYKMTIILVSHDLPEIFRLADQVIKITNGQIVEEGVPAEVFSSDEVSGKFQFVGRVHEVEHQAMISILRILVGDQLVRVIVDQSLAMTLSPGDRVLIATKAFGPIVSKI